MPGFRFTDGRGVSQKLKKMFNHYVLTETAFKPIWEEFHVTTMVILFLFGWYKKQKNTISKLTPPRLGKKS